MKKNILFLLFLLIFSQLKAQTNAPGEINNKDRVSFSLFLIGNYGKFSSTNLQQEELLKQIFEYHQNRKGIVYLGNNIYPSFSDLFDEEVEDIV